VNYARPYHLWLTNEISIQGENALFLLQKCLRRICILFPQVDAAGEVRADVVERTDTSLTYAPRSKMTAGLRRFLDAGIETMDELFTYAAGKFSHRRMVGTREILAEEDEEQPNGKVFKKWEMGDYHWKSYVQVEEVATNFGKGLRELGEPLWDIPTFISQYDISHLNDFAGLNPRENTCIFAETKAEWLMCALGCFKQSFPLVTLYANLGAEAVAHGVNETEVTHVITTHDLLPKFKSVLAKTDKVKYVIFIEDGIHQTDRSGYREGVTILSFTEVCQLGAKSNFGGCKPTKDDPAIIMYTSGSTGVPKGVVLPHESLITTVKAFHFVVDTPTPDDIYLGYLPLAHILELLSEMTMVVQGVPVGYSSPNTMIDKSTKIKKGKLGDCSVLRPSLMCAVPLVIDRIYKGIHENINGKGVFFKRLMDFCYAYKSYYRQRGMGTPIMDYLIFRKMRALVGGRIR